MTRGYQIAVWIRLPFLVCLLITTVAAADLFGKGRPAQAVSASDVNVSEEDRVIQRLKVFIYELPSKYNENFLSKESRCLSHMFAAEIHMHEFLLSSHVRTFNPDEANWFYTPVYTCCQLLANGNVWIAETPRVMRSAIRYISSKWPYWNRTEGADHFFVVPHDFGACFHYQEMTAIARGILPVLKRATLLQTFGAKNHTCFKEGSFTIPPYSPPHKLQAHVIPSRTPRSIFAYFRGLFYDKPNDPEGGYYSRGARASIWENFKTNPLFDISEDRSLTYYEDLQRSIFCLCPLGWATWGGARLVEAVTYGCIPVIIADGIVLPFADTIPWDKITVFVKEEEVPNMDSMLSSIPLDVILSKQRLLARNSIKRALLFHQPSQAGDAFHQVLLRLARKLPHDSGVFLKTDEKFLNWTEGVEVDHKPW